MIRPWGVIAIAGLIGWADLPAQVPRCESAAPTDAQIARGRSAITVARQINTAEAQLWPTTKRYAPLTELTGITVPEGFEVQVSTDGGSGPDLVEIALTA